MVQLGIPASHKNNSPFEDMEVLLGYSGHMFVYVFWRLPLSIPFRLSGDTPRRSTVGVPL